MHLRVNLVGGMRKSDNLNHSRLLSPGVVAVIIGYAVVVIVLWLFLDVTSTTGAMVISF